MESLINNIEQKILEFWKKENIFKKSLAQNRKGNFFSFFDGPPFATGLPHYGHILASTLKDLYCRYASMKGYYVPRRWGWDCHGLPIENLVEQEMEVKTKKDIEKIGIEKFNAICKSKVLKFASEWEDMVDRIGRWIEFKNAYKTMDTSYMESVWWAFKQFWNKGLIYEGIKPLLYCPRCQTPVSKFEIIMDKNYKEIEVDSIVVKFPLVKEKTQLLKKQNLSKPVYLLVWTTTPWTLPSNVAIGIRKDLDYLLVENDEGFFIIHKQALKLFDRRPRLIKVIKGKELIGSKYLLLFSRKDHETGLIIEDPYITEEGTGLVHLAPAYGEEDFHLCRKHRLPIITTLNEGGIFEFNCPDFLKGAYFEKANEIIINFLSSNNMLFKVIKFKHRYPFCWRCGTALYYNAVTSWFIDIKKIKKMLVELNKTIDWHPAHLKYGRFLKGLQSAPDWNISRWRFWATPIPLWRCQNINCRNIVCIGSIKELRNKAINFDKVYPDYHKNIIDLHRPYIDMVLLRCEKCKDIMVRVKDVLDCWFESASMPFAEIHYPFENKKFFEKRYPADFVAEYIAQTRAWFYVMLVVNGVLFHQAPFKHVLTTGTVLNEKGEKLSKSRKNFPDPWHIIHKYGADALRFYLLSSPVIEARDLFFSEEGVKNVYRKIVNILLNLVALYKFYEMGALAKKLNIEKFNFKTGIKDTLHKWILSYIYYKKNLIKDALDNYETKKACKEIENCINMISLWYVKFIKDLIKIKDQESIVVYSWILYQLSKIIAPFMPFMGEYLYQSLNFVTKKSVHLEKLEDINYLVNKKLIDDMEKVKKIIQLGLSAKKPVV
ncbi:Isoleucine--tRNA ligase 2 [bacterium HR35]|nr:Isoleucine--tRNA ligase 2 [bacterium HR35]